MEPNVAMLLIVAVTMIVIILEVALIAEMTRGGHQSSAATDNPRPTEVEKTEAPRCLHFLGYLAEHPRNEPVPTECFGCKSAPKCITTKSTETSSTNQPTPAPLERT